MNKRCTNSSCRKTFSTLEFSGECPYCGKVYPQLIATRKHGTPGRNYIRINIGKDLQFRISLVQVLALLAVGKKLDAIHNFIEEVRKNGYNPHVKDSKEFCEALMEGEKPCTTWLLTPSKRDGLPIIKSSLRQ